MMKIITLSLLSMILILLSACQSALIKSDNVYTEVSAQATIEITRMIEVAPNSARAFFQNGELIRYGQLNLYDVNCEIEINTVAEEIQQISPGIYNVIAIRQEESPIVNRTKQKSVMVASLSYSPVAFSSSSDSPVDIKLYYHFRLARQKQADDASSAKTQVRAVICRGAQSEPYDARLPTYEEMKIASGPYILFNL
jgi:hypothetical protein